MADQRSLKTRPTTLSQQGSTVLSRSRNIIYYVITVVENNKDNENHGSRRIKHLFLVSRKIILQNHASRLLWKSRFTRKKLAISHFTGKKKGPITSHENTLYHPLENVAFDSCDDWVLYQNVDERFVVDNYYVWIQTRKVLEKMDLGKS